MPKIQGICIIPGCHRLQRKRAQKGYRAVCRKHCGQSPNQKLNEKQQQVKKIKIKFTESIHQIKIMTGYRCNSYQSFLKRSS